MQNPFQIPLPQINHPKCTKAILISRSRNLEEIGQVDNKLYVLSHLMLNVDVETAELDNETYHETQPARFFSKSCVGIHSGTLHALSVDWGQDSE